MKHFSGLIVVTLFLYQLPAVAQDEYARKDVGFTFGVGYVQGKDYPWMLGEFWRGKGFHLSKTNFFLNLESGVEFRVMYDLYLNPRLRWLVSRSERVGVEGYVTGKTATEIISILLPDVSMKYYLFNVGHHYLYVNGMIGGILPFSGNPELALASNGTEQGYGGGYQYVTRTYGLGLEVNYLSIPIKVTSFEPANFGGWEITLILFF